MSDYWDVLIKEELTSRQRLIIGFLSRANSSILASFLITLQWLGAWNLLTQVWPSNLYWARDTIYVVIGCIMLFLAEKWVPLSDIDEDRAEAWGRGVPETFEWKRKLKHFILSEIHFVAFLFFWVGSWTILDEYMFPWSLPRELIYIALPVIILLICQECFSLESLYWMCVKHVSEEEPLSEDPLLSMSGRSGES